MTIRDGDHANEFETSLMLHLTPELVDMAAAEDGGYQAFRIPAIAAPGIWAPRDWQALTASTGTGDPRHGNAVARGADSRTARRGVRAVARPAFRGARGRLSLRHPSLIPPVLCRPAMQFRPLLPADLPAAVSLSTQAGWNQTMVHWSRFLAIWPQAAIAGCVDDQVVATGTLALYPSATGAEVMAWIGMILVDEGMRGRGYGARLFTAMLDRAEALNVSLLGLDATDLGRPLYERHGFRDQQLLSSLDRPARHRRRGVSRSLFDRTAHARR